MFNAAQLRTVLRALVNLDPYTFADDLAEEFPDEADGGQRSAEEVLMSVIDRLTDGKLTAFTLQLALSGHRGLPREGEIDFLAEVAAAFPALPARKAASRRKSKTPTPIKAAPKRTMKKAVKKNLAV